MGDKDKYMFHVHEFGAASVPQYQEVIKNKPWVFYGDDNLFPNHLLALYQYSSINRACINAITYGVNGKDLIVVEGDPTVIEQANKFESVYEVYKKCAVDRVLFGGFANNVIKSNGGDIAEIYHTDFSRLRAGKQDDFGVVNTYYYSVDWKGVQHYGNKYKPVEMPSFRLVNDEDTPKSQILYTKKYTPGMDYYPAPDWVAGITSAQLDIEIKNFHLNNMQNSMMPSVAISFANGIPSEEERDILYRQLESKYSSTNNAGKFFLFFSENADTKPDITPIPNNASDAWYSSMNPQIEQNILTAHRITSPMILGIKTAGQLGGRNEILDSYELFLETVIKPIQEEVLSVFEKLIYVKTKQEVKLGIVQNQLLSQQEIKE